MSNRINIKRITLALVMAGVVVVSNAQTFSNRIGLGAGALYERGVDATLSVEHETRNHNVWEYFLDGYVKYAKDEKVGHVTMNSFWRNYRTWSLGIAYKPCVFIGKNNYGSLRLGGSVGSDTNECIGVVHAGYEHDFVLHNGLRFYVQAKTGLCINGLDLLKSGISIGMRVPVGAR